MPFALTARHTEKFCLRHNFATNRVSASRIWDEIEACRKSRSKLENSRAPRYRPFPMVELQRELGRAATQSSRTITAFPPALEVIFNPRGGKWHWHIASFAQRFSHR